ncbi:KRI1-like family C-terminal-domain-containing protein [Cladochytrium replicatum]|nr:KRI1-like family C-terminal-domain-containing protein [Cladochytrium replicatum]
MPRKKKSSHVTLTGAASSVDAADTTSSKSFFSLEENNDDGDGDLGFTINEAYAEKFETRKRNEELNDLTHKYGADLAKKKLEGGDDEFEDEEDEEEDEDGALVTPAIDAAIVRTWIKIREGKSEVYDPNRTFFNEEEIEKARQEWERKIRSKKEHEKKPMTIGEVKRQALLKKVKDFEEDGAVHSDSDDDDGPRGKNAGDDTRWKDELKRAALDDDKDEGDFLTVRERTEKEVEDQEEAYRNFLLESMAAEGAEGILNWKKYAAEGESTDGKRKDQKRKKGKTGDEPARPPLSEDPDEAFLLDYILNRGWMEKPRDKIPSYDEIVANHHDDEDNFDDAEAFELAQAVEREREFEEKIVRHRFEEEGATELVTYARNIPDSVRATSDKRKLAREAREQRKKEAEEREREEVERLMELRRLEVLERLRKIQANAGVEGEDDIAGGVLAEVLGDDEFDEGGYEKAMAAAFGDDYYGSEDPSKKPEFDDDIEIGDLVGEDAEYPVNGEEAWGGDEVIEIADFPEDTPAPPPKVSKKTSLDTKKLAKGPRFRYREVSPESFGLSGTDILLAPDDTELNELVSLKTLAPYRRVEQVERDRRRLSNRKRRKRVEEFKKRMQEEWEGLLSRAEEVQAEAEEEEGEDEGADKKKRKKKKSSGTEGAVNAAKEKEEEKGGISKKRLEAYGLS